MNWTQLLNAGRPGSSSASQHPTRSPFQQDYDRIIFSQSFRSLQDKTQVFPLAGQDFAHTRLTHSLEVSSVGRSLGSGVGHALIQKHPELEGFTAHDFGAIVAAAALAHDIGNPPFGHAGEAGISEFFQKYRERATIQEAMSEAEWADICNFEGNAQGFRLLNQDNRQGLRMTYAMLGAFTKYPRPSLLTNAEKERKSQKKYGFHQHDQKLFSSMAAVLGLLPLDDSLTSWCRHPLAFLVEAADDICYTIIDLEDGTTQGWINYQETETLLVNIIGNRFDKVRLSQQNSIPEKTGTLRAMAISQLIEEIVKVFLDNEPAMLDGSFDKSLSSLIPSSGHLRSIQDISVDKIYRSRQVIEREAAGFEVLHGLLEVFVPPLLHQFLNRPMSWKEKCMMRMLPKETQYDVGASESLYEKLLFLMDYISGLTDSKALNLFRNIRGISLPGVR